MASEFAVGDWVVENRPTRRWGDISHRTPPMAYVTWFGAVAESWALGRARTPLVQRTMLYALGRMSTSDLVRVPHDLRAMAENDRRIVQRWEETGGY